MRHAASLLCVLILGCGSSVEATPPPASEVSVSETGGEDAALDVALDVTGGEAGACVSDVTPAPGTVITDRGAVTGTKAGKTWAYLGIPFAAPPTGALRLKAPTPHACWSGARTADKFGAVCPQLEEGGKVVGQEDCLTLNVWTPEPAPTSGKRPIMVFIHGGGHSQGSSAMRTADGLYLYDGQNFVEKAAAREIILVTINYRLGPLGWLAHAALTAESPDTSSGMLGHLDQVAALKWVQKNAAAFGGDPSRVTIFGESAGGVSVCSLVASALAKGLFAGAIMESGGCPGRKLSEAETIGKKIADAAGCTTGDVPACLRGLTTEKLLTAIPAKIEVAGRTGDYTAVVDGYALPATPLELIASGKHNAVDFIFGSNSDETSRSVPPIASEDDYRKAVLALLPTPAIADAVMAQYPSSEYGTPRKAFVALTSDVKFICPLRAVGKAFAKGQTKPTYRYVFSHALDNAPALKPLGAWHGLELVFLFDHLKVGGYVASAAEQTLADTMIGYWSAFGAKGVPEGPVVWPKWDATDPYLKLDITIGAANGVRTKQCDFWDTLL